MKVNGQLVIEHENLQRKYHKPRGLPTSVTWLQLLRTQTNTDPSAALICRNILIYTHTASRILLPCDINLGSLTLPALEAGIFVELLLFYWDIRRLAVWKWGSRVDIFGVSAGQWLRWFAGLLLRLRLKLLYGAFQHVDRLGLLYSYPNKFPHSSPEASCIIEMREISTSEGGNYSPQFF
jgi:hypothetical protein